MAAVAHILLLGCASSPPMLREEADPQVQACPKEVPEGARCVRGQDRLLRII